MNTLFACEHLICMWTPYLYMKASCWIHNVLFRSSQIGISLNSWAQHFISLGGCMCVLGERGYATLKRPTWIDRLLYSQILKTGILIIISLYLCWSFIDKLCLQSPLNASEVIQWLRNAKFQDFDLPTYLFYDKISF